MTPPFPIGWSGPAAFYLLAYLLTLTVHMLFVGYVGAGTLYLTQRFIRGGAAERDPLYATLRDWLPFILGLGITFGVAPLLFVQVLYREIFYTSRILLYGWSLGLIGLLFIGFYALYFIKSPKGQGASKPWLTTVLVITFLCFLGVALYWTAGHVLSLNNNAWISQYANERTFYLNARVLSRFAIWFAAAWPCMTSLVALQMNRGTPPIEATILKRLGLSSILGTLVAMGAALFYVSQSPEPAKVLVQSPSFWPWVLLLGLGGLVHCGLWARIGLQGKMQPKAAWLQLVLCGFTVFSAMVVRESERLALPPFAQESLEQRASEAFAGSAVIPFTLALLVVSILLGWLLRRVAITLKDSEVANGPNAL